MTIRAGVFGATGYAGLELVRLLLNHPEVEISLLGSNSNAGMEVMEFYPHLHHPAGNRLPRRFTAIDAGEAARETDLLFTALPSGVSGSLMPGLLDAGCRVIDLSGDLRLPPGLYKEWYGHEPVAEDVRTRFAYGLCELFRDEIAGAVHISNPGCYATAAELPLAPLIAGGVIRPDRLIIDAKSGVSGAGRNVKLTSLFAEVHENFSTYKIGRHQHTPEIEHHLQRLAPVPANPVRISFTPQLVPMTRGILCTIYAEIDPAWQGSPGTERILEILQTYYADAPFVRVRAAGSMPSTRQVWGSNFCDIGAHYEERTGRIILVSVIDNLVKGAAGQAVQNFNIMFGFPEDLGLKEIPVNP